jgi:hypothetical protein
VTDVDAISVSSLTGIGIGVTVALVVLGVILGLIVTAILGRVLIALVVIGLAIFVWVERGAIENKVADKACPPSLSFFGVHVDAPDSYRHYCRVHGAHHPASHARNHSAGHHGDHHAGAHHGRPAHG